MGCPHRRNNYVDDVGRCHFLFSAVVVVVFLSCVDPYRGLALLLSQRFTLALTTARLGAEIAAGCFK